MRPNWQAIFAVAALVSTGLASAPVSASSAQDDTSQRLPGVLILDTLPGTPGRSATETIQPDTAGRSALLRSDASEKLTSPAGGFTLCHDASVPAAVLADVLTALQEWSETLAMSGPTIAIDFGWIPLTGNGSLGVAGPSEFIVDPRLPLPGTGYPIALANELLGTDENGPGCGAANSEMALYLNSTAGGDGSLWNIGDDSAIDNQVDLSTVVLHEVGHGLGVVSAAQLVNDRIEWPRTSTPIYVYDHYFGECSSESVVGCDSELTPLNSANSNSLRGTRLWFRNLSGQALELHAPTEWSGGSSVSHLDEVRYPASSGFSLMTPYLRRGETFGSVDPALQSLVQTLGWRLSSVPAPPSNVSATAGNGRIDISFQRPTLASGAPATAYRVTLSANGSIVRSADTGAGVLGFEGLTNGVAHQVQVAAINSAGSSAAAIASNNRLIPLELPPFATAEGAARQLYRDLLGLDPSAAESAAIASRLRSTSSLAAEASTVAADARLERRLQVVRLYLGFFERDPDPAGLQYWFDEVGRGVSLDVVASSFAIASEFQQGQTVPASDFIDAAYGRILDRSPDEVGKAYWLTQLARGLDRGQMLILFSESAEHVAKTRVPANVLAISFGMLARPLTTTESADFASVVSGSGAPGLARQLAASADYDLRHRPR